jgi:hypothetical protein
MSSEAADCGVACARRGKEATAAELANAVRKSRRFKLPLYFLRYAGTALVTTVALHQLAGYSTNNAVCSI